MAFRSEDLELLTTVALQVGVVLEKNGECVATAAGAAALGHPAAAVAWLVRTLADTDEVTVMQALSGG